MFARGLTLSLATLLAFGIVATSADADHRKKHRRVIVYDNYYSGPEFVRKVPGLRVFFGDYALTEEEFDALYGIDKGRDSFDESYYEPEPAPVKPRKKPAAKTVTTTKKPAAKDVTTASIDSAKKPAANTAKPIAKAAASGEDAPAVKKPAVASAAGMTCDKAGSIVSGYGFSGVKAQTCQGKVYAFNATRDGKTFAIKVDSASGELTEVRKLQ